MYAYKLLDSMHVYVLWLCIVLHVYVCAVFVCTDFSCIEQERSQEAGFGWACVTGTSEVHDGVLCFLVDEEAVGS